MTKITAYDAMGFGLDFASADSDVVPLTNLTDDWITESGPNRVKVFQEYDDGDYLMITNFVLLSETKIKLTSMRLEGRFAVDLVKFEGINLKIDEDDNLAKINLYKAFVGGDDRITGNNFADTINARNGNDVVYGNGGQDDLKGAAGNDRLFGGQDEDVLNGGKDNDKLVGGAGYDILKGGKGADSFVFRPGFEQDTIKDFSDRDDVLDLRNFGLSSVADAKSRATMIDGDTVFDFGGGDLLILRDFDMSALDKGDFII